MQFTRLKGISTHNLKNIDVDFPRHRLIAVTGVSGSGKSSLVMDTLCREAGRIYTESLALSMGKWPVFPHFHSSVRELHALTPVIAAIRQGERRERDSSLLEIAGLEEAMASLMKQTGCFHCPRCGRAIVSRSVAGIADELAKKHGGKTLRIFAPVTRTTGNPVEKILRRFLKQGFIKVRRKGELQYIDDLIRQVLQNPQGQSQSLDLLIDVIQNTPPNRTQMEESLSLAREKSGNTILVTADEVEIYFSTGLYCRDCAESYPKPDSAVFRRKSGLAECKKCRGDGSHRGKPCNLCRGSGLNRYARSFFLRGQTFPDLVAMTVEDLQKFLSPMEKDQPPDSPLFSIRQTLGRMRELGLGYLATNRMGDTLSRGEYQRARLVGQLREGLTGIMYVLDEPTVGLHPREQGMLIRLMKDLKSKGNTVLVVEHERRIIRAADWLIELGPEGGEKGGHLMYQGSPKDRSDPPLEASCPRKQRPFRQPLIQTGPLSLRNVRLAGVSFPSRCLIAVTGVSGSGKSTLVMDLLVPRIRRRIRKSRSGIPAENKTADIQGVVAIGSLPRPGEGRSTVGTYLNLMKPLRQLFSRLPEARIRGYGELHFSHTRGPGKCLLCGGRGILNNPLTRESSFYHICHGCGGSGFREEVREIKYRGHSIADFIGMEIVKLKEIFESTSILGPILNRLQEMGLGYLSLGEKIHCLSGGEWQKLALCRELLKNPRGPVLYCLDEPSSGLHPQDIQKLLAILRDLIGNGHTIIAIEHNSDIICSAEYIIEMGPGSGQKGGKIVCQGTVEEILRTGNSLTRRWMTDRYDGF